MLAFNDAKLQHLKQLSTLCAAQGTEAWIESRRSQFGGSEISTVLGQNPYQTISELINKKISGVYEDQPACVFGRLFEPVAKLILTRRMNWEIHEFSCFKSAMFPVAYSPDGVLIDGDDLKLLEIKCPFRRNNLKEIPEYYRPQVQTGMAIIPVVSTLFVQLRFRLCSLQQLGPNPKYNRWFHHEPIKRVPAKDPVTWGYIVWEDESSCIRDCGLWTPHNQHKLLELPSIDKATRIVLEPEPNQYPSSGQVIPFKLLEINITEIPPIPNYLEKNKKQIWNAFAELHKMQIPFQEECIHNMTQVENAMMCNKCGFMKEEIELVHEFVEILKRDHDHYNKSEYIEKKLDRMNGDMDPKKYVVPHGIRRYLVAYLREINPSTWLETRRMLSLLGMCDFLLDLPPMVDRHIHAPHWVRTLITYIYQNLRLNMKLEYILAGTFSAVGWDATWIPLSGTPATLKKYAQEWRDVCPKINMPLTNLNIKKLDWKKAIDALPWFDDATIDNIRPKQVPADNGTPPPEWLDTIGFTEPSWLREKLTKTK